MDKIIITVEEIKDNGETRTLTQEIEHDGQACNMSELFRTIMYWQTFCPVTIDNWVRNKWDEDSFDDVGF